MGFFLGKGNPVFRLTGPEHDPNNPGPMLNSGFKPMSWPLQAVSVTRRSPINIGTGPKGVLGSGTNLWRSWVVFSQFRPRQFETLSWSHAAMGGRGVEVRGPILRV